MGVQGADHHESSDAGSESSGPAGRSDEEQYASYGRQLVAAADECVRDWVVRSVRTVADRAGAVLGDDELAAMTDAAERARAEVVENLDRLMRIDIDEQRSSPLEVIRAAVKYPTAVLRSAGVAPVDRDEFSVRQFPDDDYDLVPASFAEVDERLHEPGLHWGAAKAHLHLRRRRAP